MEISDRKDDFSHNHEDIDQLIAILVDTVIKQEIEIKNLQRLPYSCSICSNSFDFVPTKINYKIVISYKGWAIYRCIHCGKPVRRER